MEMTLDAQIRDAAVINHHPANAITQSRYHAGGVLKNQTMFFGL
jgi:hypothetical protein